tara:strand:+ start:531 stop:809 length:279 start_codon:yes stop_codon:yes gene_type:complete
MDKKPLQSKKFIAYLIADFGWKVALFYILYQSKSKFDYYSFSVVLTLLIVSGFIQVGYILGQAALDKYTEVAKNITNDTPPPNEKGKINESK